MREIKFRAWDYKNDRMRDWEDVSTNWAMHILNDPAKLGCNSPASKTRTGKEIYEGHVVRHRKLNRPEDGVMYGLGEQLLDDRPREVKFEGCGFTPLAGWVDQALKDMGWEVIGNIYENPELIGKWHGQSGAQ
jgi:YopX protein